MAMYICYGVLMTLREAKGLKGIKKISKGVSRLKLLSFNS